MMFILAVSFMSLLLQDRPSTKVHSVPGGGSSLGYLFGNGGGGSGGN